MEVANTLQTRKNTHGDYAQQADLSMKLFRYAYLAKNWTDLQGDQKESIILILVKLGRILTGNPNEADHWHDIAGYAQLVENRLNGKPSNGVIQAGYNPGYDAAREAALKRAFTEDVKPTKKWVEPVYPTVQQGAQWGDASGRVGGCSQPGF